MHTSSVQRSRVGVWIKDIKDTRRESARVPGSFILSRAGCMLVLRPPPPSSTSHTLCFSYCARYHFYCRRASASFSGRLYPSPRLSPPRFSLLLYFPPLSFFSPFLMNINHDPHSTKESLLFYPSSLFSIEQQIFTTSCCLERSKMPPHRQSAKLVCMVTRSRRVFPA